MRVCVGVVPCAIGAVGVAVVVVVPSQAAGAVRVALCGQRAQHPLREKDTFKDIQSQIAERKTGGGRGPGDRSSEAA